MHHDVVTPRKTDGLASRGGGVDGGDERSWPEISLHLSWVVGETPVTCLIGTSRRGHSSIEVSRFLSKYLQSALLPGDCRERKVPLFLKSVFE